MLRLSAESTFNTFSMEKHEGLQDGALVRSRSVAEHKWLNSLVYGRYNELAPGVSMVYKPTNITRGQHPVGML